MDENNHEYKYYTDLKRRLCKTYLFDGQVEIVTLQKRDGSGWVADVDSLTWLKHEWLTSQKLLTEEQYLAKTTKLGKILYD